MNRSRVLLGVLAILSLALTIGALAQPQAPTNQDAATSQSPQSAPTVASAPAGDQPDMLSMPSGVLISTESLLGIGVRNPQGEHVGGLKQLMIDHRTGRVMYAVVAMGGFLGIGEKTIVVPWQALQVIRDGRSLAVNLAPHVLEQAPK